jgi:DNA integrity scanning protein DisA with diadenylate cyclase activity
VLLAIEDKSPVLGELKEEGEVTFKEMEKGFRMIYDEQCEEEDMMNMIFEETKSMVEKIGEVEKICSQIKNDTKEVKEKAKLKVCEMEEKVNRTQEEDFVNDNSEVDMHKKEEVKDLLNALDERMLAMLVGWKNIWAYDMKN